MNKDYCLSGTKIVMRRLFKYDMEEIISCYHDYTALYHNPVNQNFLENVFHCGEIWGAFFKSDLIGCCYYFPFKSSFYKTTASYSAISDFLDNTGKFYYMGYVGFKKHPFNEKNGDDIYGGIYQAFLNIAQMQAFRRDYKYILHTVPLKISDHKEKIFSCGYSLIKLRGLENLVVHYIFAKAVFNEENIYEIHSSIPVERIPADDTKKVSALLENGYHCIDYSKEENCFCIQKSVADQKTFFHCIE